MLYSDMIEERQLPHFYN